MLMDNKAHITDREICSAIAYLAAHVRIEVLQVDCANTLSLRPIVDMPVQMVLLPHSHQHEV